MDTTMKHISRLYNNGHTVADIARRTKLSNQKVRKILITLGRYTTPLISKINEMYKNGVPVAQIAADIGITSHAVTSMLPYMRGMYNAEYPTQNALSIRRCRKKNNKSAQ